MHINIFHFSDFNSASFSLPDHTIDVWLLETLDPKFSKYHLQHLTAHELLHLLLGRYLHLPQQEIPLRTGAHGKLYLDYDALTKMGLGDFPKITFNLSHSGNQLAFAFSSTSPVGIDIEMIKKQTPVQKIVHRFFHPEEEARFSGLYSEEHRKLFFRYWTIREAFLKGLGTGFTIPSDSFRIDEIPDNPGRYKISGYPLWQVQSIPVPAPYLCSLAYIVQNPL